MTNKLHKKKLLQLVTMFSCFFLKLYKKNHTCVSYEEKKNFQTIKYIFFKNTQKKSKPRNASTFESTLLASLEKPTSFIDNCTFFTQRKNP